MSSRPYPLQWRTIRDAYLFFCNRVENRSLNRQIYLVSALHKYLLTQNDFTWLILVTVHILVSLVPCVLPLHTPDNDKVNQVEQQFWFSLMTCLYGCNSLPKNQFTDLCLRLV